MTDSDRELTRTAFRTTSVPEHFFHVASGEANKVQARVIKVNDTNTFTTLEEREVRLEDGAPVDDDLALGVVVARSSFTGPLPERGNTVLIGGLGLTRGAYASTFAHDSHNVFVVGRSPAAMRRALEAVLERGGGMAVAPDEHVEPILLPLPVAGLLADDPVDEVGATFDRLETTLRTMGVRAKNPILLLTILPLTVSPEFKISDKGLVDVENRRIIDAFVPA
jgi:adenine deaminase